MSGVLHVALSGATNTDGLSPAAAAALHHERMVYVLIGELGNSLSVHDTLSVLDAGLSRLVLYHDIAVYLPHNHLLSPAYVNGENARLFSSLEFPYGQGLSGLVAETRRPVINGDPSAELGLGDVVQLRSALAVPLENGANLTGVLALYHSDPDAFGPGDLEVLLAIRQKAAIAIENALRYEQAERSASIDPVSLLPNARALFLRMDAELARCRRSHGSLAVLVCNAGGQAANGRLVRAIAAGLRNLCREDDCVARTGDEFVLVLSGISPADLIEKQARIESLIDQLSQAHPGGSRLAVRMGAAFYPEDGADAEDLLATAGSRLQIASQPGPTAAEPFTLQLTGLGAALDCPALDCPALDCPGAHPECGQPSGSPGALPETETDDLA